MDVANGYGVATEVHYELAVAEDADYVALLAGEETGEDTELYVVAGELFEMIAQEGHTGWVLLHNTHEGAHHGVGDRRGKTGAAIVYQKILGKVLCEEPSELARFALEEYKAAYGGLFHLYYALAVGLLLEVRRAVHKAAGLEIALHISGVEPFLEGYGRHVVHADVAPRESVVRIFCTCAVFVLG